MSLSHAVGSKPDWEMKFWGEKFNKKNQLKNLKKYFAIQSKLNAIKQAHRETRRGEKRGDDSIPENHRERFSIFDSID